MCFLHEAIHFVSKPQVGMSSVWNAIVDKIHLYIHIHMYNIISIFNFILQLQYSIQQSKLSSFNVSNFNLNVKGGYYMTDR